jgi:hypothetical protein
LEPRVKTRPGRESDNVDGAEADTTDLLARFVRHRKYRVKALLQEAESKLGTQAQHDRREPIDQTYINSHFIKTGRHLLLLEQGRGIVPYNSTVADRETRR